MDSTPEDATSGYAQPDPDVGYLDPNVSYADSIATLTFSKPEVGVIGVAYALVFVVGIVGNCFVIAVVARTPQMWCATHFFIANLAFADVLVLMFCLPVNFIQNVFFDYILGLFVCKVVTWLQGVSVSVSVTTLAAISLERYFAICYPIRYQMSLQIARRVIVCTWIYSCAAFVPWLVYYHLFTPYPQRLPDIEQCRDWWPSPLARTLHYLFVTFFATYFLPLLIISGTYMMIFARVWRREIPGDATTARYYDKLASKQKVKVAKMVLIVVCMFALSWLPLHVLYMLSMFGAVPYATMSEAGKHAYRYVQVFVLWLGIANSSVNPVVYAYLNRKYRLGFRAILRSRSCSKRLQLSHVGGSSRQTVHSSCVDPTEEVLQSHSTAV
ncbi:PREDICTED: neuropeptide FF receptor 2-like [Priapulus caudatus]|uniref:Neuropeptide FF receptor 2-like n=1 Tax=Priapulus caudatus TaxID=37621 RepID=A0ABM1EKZ1_PRICU|nr:PREDICTED: neuropeptide FF receptor 2-like [Priapulus caudatus]